MAKQAVAPTAEPTNTAGSARSSDSPPSARPHAASMSPAGRPTSALSSARLAGAGFPASAGTIEPTTSSTA